MTTQISSTELQLLVFRYLKESGFDHSAYVFAVESAVASSEAATADVPPGSLVSFVHKGLLFSQLEREVEDPKRARLSNLTEIEGENGAAGIVILRGHQTAVYACTFHPKDGSILATGSGDSMARIWRLDEKGVADCRLLEHSSLLKNPNGDETMTDADNGSKKRDTEKDPFAVSTLAWNPSGTLLASGCLDGKIRLWTKEGESAGSLIQHSGPIFCLKWSPSGSLLVSGGQDKTAIIWDVEARSARRSFDLPHGQMLDVDWCPSANGTVDDVFAASCGNFLTICSLSTGNMVSFKAHEDDINAVKWSADGRMVATCSDDAKAKIWIIPSLSALDPGSQPSCVELDGHTKEVYMAKWCPSTSADKPTRLATASFDGTVKIWDARSGKLVHALKEHSGAVYAIEFDTTGQFLLSGGNDKLVNLWSVETGVLRKSVKVPGGVFDISWNVRCDKYAVALSNSNVVVVDY